MALLVMLVVTLAPPAQGPILVVSLRAETAGDIARWAIARDARLLGRGPLPNSLVVVGSRANLLGEATRRGSMLMAGRLAGCGNGNIL